MLSVPSRRGRRGYRRAFFVLRGSLNIADDRARCDRHEANQQDHLQHAAVDEAQHYVDNPRSPGSSDPDFNHHFRFYSNA